jgi:ParB family chromosome partitioning protein
MAKPVLGRGLGALLGGAKPSMAAPAPAPAAAKPASALAPTPAPVPAVVDNRERVERVAVTRVHPCPFQPRKDFTEEAIRELADSIKEQGIVQPLIVRARGDGFELIAGERRWRAAQSIGLKEVPVIVREADDRQVLELALIENLQRENLNAIEEALGYQQLISQFNLKQDETALKVGKSRAAVANALRLLKLTPDNQSLVREGKLSVGHAKVILGLDRVEQQNQAAFRILKDGLSVRQTEEMISHWAKAPVSATTAKAEATAAPAARDIHITDVESKLRERFGTKVSLRYRQGKGSVEIKFFSDDELERILQISGVKMD